MKTHKHLWEQFISPENLDLAARRAVRGKRGRRSTRRFLRHRAQRLEKLREMLIRGEFTTGKYRIFTIFEPKKRNIYMLPLYPDHLVHHALMNILAPIWQNLFISDSYACIPGRGLHTASQRCVAMLRKNRYVLQCDISKFYPSINHDIMMKIIRRKISDPRILALLHDIVYSTEGQRGMPIGNLTSQWMGNLYMNDLDMFVKHNMRVKNYIRYCDDFCIFDNDREKLVRYKKILQEFLARELDLRFSKAFIKNTNEGVNFIGYRHFKNHVVLTRAGAKKMRRKILNLARHPEISPNSKSCIAAFWGWTRWCCCKNMRRRINEMVEQNAPPEFAHFFKMNFN